MPETPELPDDLARRLRARAVRLDAGAPPIEPAEARTGRAAPAPSRRWLPVAAAVAVLGAVGAAWLLAAGGDDPEELILPADTSTTSAPVETTSTAPGSTTTTDPRRPTNFSDVPDMGIAVVQSDGVLRILDLDGNELYLENPSPETWIGPSFHLMDVWQPTPIDPAQVPDGCESAFGGGGVRVALCDGESQRPRTLEVVDSTGERRRLSGPPTWEDVDDGQPTQEQAGAWRWALPSPDGRWVLAQWSGECEVPEAYLTPTDGEGVPLHLDPVPAGTTSYGIGWSDDGQAIVVLPPSGCGTAAEQPGVYLLDPDARALSLVEPFGEGDRRAFVWHNRRFENDPERLLFRALDELGLAPYGGEPSHGGPEVTSGAVFEGAEIGIVGSPRRPAEEVAAMDRALEANSGQQIQRLPLLHGEAAIVPFTDPLLEGPLVRFDCGAYTWTLTWHDEGTPEVDSMLLLAEALVPHLYCTLPPSSD